MFASKTKALFVAVAILASAGAAQAQQKAAFVIYNPTENTLHYEVKFGPGDFKKYQVPPRQEMAHWINLIGGERPAPAVVRFDYICGDPDVTYKDYTIDYYVVDDAFRGRTYFFRYDSTGRFLDLLHETGK